MTGSSRLPRAVLALALVSACAAPRAQPIVGPDGSTMAHVSCGAEQAECFRLAGELCPSGYEMQPVLSGNHGNFLVRCRAARAVAQAEMSCPARPTDAAGPTNAGWPATSEPWPDGFAWSPPETSAGVYPVPAPASGEPDLGY